MNRLSWSATALIVFTASIGAKDSGLAISTPGKPPCAPSPLFSVSGLSPRDSVSVKNVLPSPLAPLSAPETTQNGRSAESCATKAPLKVNVAIDSPNTDSSRTIKAVSSKSTLNFDEQKNVQRLSPPSPLKFARVEINKQKLLKHRPWSINALLDARFGILLLSIVILGVFLRNALKKATQPTFVTTTRLSIMDKEVQTACRYIEKNYKDKELSLESVCVALITGKAFLDALFHQELGMSVEEFIAQVRINRARMLIEKDTSVSAETAAVETGFCDADSFAKAFDAIVGMSFDHYRNARANNAD